MTVLRQLQELDQRLWSLRRRLAELPEQLGQAQAARDAQAARVAEAEAVVKTVQLQQRSKEVELGSQEAALKKAQAQLYQVKTNKEYTALQHEIEGFKADRSVLEDEIIALLDQVEQAQRVLVQHREALQRKEEVLRAAKLQLDDEAQQLQTELRELEARRQELVPQVPAGILAIYERVLANREGVALVPVEQESCGGCHMALPPQVVHEVRMVEKLMACDSCARLLYWRENEGE